MQEHEDPDWDDELVFYCPQCAELESGDSAVGRRSFTSPRSQWCEALDQAFWVHGLPDGEIALEFDVCVWSCEGSRSGRCVDDLMIDHFDDALAAL